MTLGRLLVAWLIVAVWFYLATFLAEIAMSSALRPPGQQGWFASIPVWLLRWRAVEASVITLLASLWFDSIGRGGWWIVFLLVGILESVPAQMLLTTPTAPRRKTVIGAGVGADLVRYLIAGALLAWRLA